MPAFTIIAEAARKRLQSKKLPPEYSKRLEFEISEIYSQGCERIWQSYITEKRKFDKNPNSLLLPWLLNCLIGPANVDPIATRTEPLVLTSRFSEVKRIIEQCGKLPSDLRLDDDKPDIDIDCLPEARDKIKDYAALRYGKNNVASVGTWQSYLLKHAIGDAYIALGLDKEDGGTSRGPVARGSDRNLAVQLTKDLPDDVNEMREGGFGACKGRVKDGDVEKECGCKHNQLKCPECGSGDTETPTIAKILAENPTIGKFIEAHPRHQEVIDIAVKLVGKIRNAGKHAGGIVISDRDLFGNVPMALDKSAGQWVTVWTEGRSTQLSKFGYLKWDWLGLKNLAYIKRCGQMIEENYGVSFGERLEGWDETNPNTGIAGFYWENGEKTPISLNDPKALDLANRSLTDAIFQFDTDLAKRSLSLGVRSFNDLLIFNAMGHPGPLADLPEYVERRDNPETDWKHGEHPEIIKILNDTCGIIVFQEQLAAVWQRVAGFTGPEAQEARKAVAKKWRDKLKPVRQKWVDGASKEIGESKAIEWWDTMERFGRYAFNRCIAAGTLVRTVTNEWLPIELCAGQFIESECGPDLIKDVHFNGIVPTYRVRFSNGSEEIVTIGHRYLTDSGYKTVAELSQSNICAVKYVSGGVEHGEACETYGVGRVGSCETISTWRDVRCHSCELGLQSNVGRDDKENNQEARCKTQLQNQNTTLQSTYLFGCLDSRSMLLDWVIDGRWICKRQEGIRTATIANTGQRACFTVYGILRRTSSKDCAEKETGWKNISWSEVHSLQQTISRQIEERWGCKIEDWSGDDTGLTISNGLSQGFLGWRWHSRYECQGISDGWVRFEFAVYAETATDTLSKRSTITLEQSKSSEEQRRYCENIPVSVDWIRAVQTASGLDIQDQITSIKPKVKNNRIYLISVEPYKEMPVYSPEMLSEAHNYSIAPGHPIAANSHAVAYCLWAYRCLWLKAHYPEEWWASVMGLCDQKALERYMGAARTEGVLFGEIALGRMTKEPIANSGRNAVEGHKQVALGLTSLKNVGDSIADVFVDTEGNKTYTDIDDFIAKKGKSKTLLERLIKLGVFVGLHPNIKATWRWYLHEYCTGDLSEFEAANCKAFDDLDDQAAQEIKRIKAQIKSKSPNQSRFKFPIKIIREYHRRQLLANDGWTAETIAVERDRQIAEYKRLYPKRKILPKKLLNWMPNPNDTRERVMALYTNDYDLRQVLQFEKEFLGYYWHSPCDLYHCSGAHTVEHAKVNECLEGVIIDVFYGVTKLKSTMLKLKISDGKRECLVIVWEQDLRHQPRKLLATDVGVKLQVDYDPDRNSFTLQRGTLIEQLWSKKVWMELQATAE